MQKVARPPSFGDSETPEAPVRSSSSILSRARASIRARFDLQSRARSGARLVKVARAIRLQGKPLRVLAMIFFPRVAVGMTRHETEAPTQPLPAEPARQLRRRAKRDLRMAVEFVLRDAEIIQPCLHAVVIRSAADLSLRDERREFFFERPHRDGLARRRHETQLARPQAAKPEHVLEKRGHGVTRAVGIGRRPLVGAEQHQCIGQSANQDAAST